MAGKVRKAARNLRNKMRISRNFRVVDVRFHNAIRIYYARIPNQGPPNEVWLQTPPPAVAASQPGVHVAPAAIRPAPNQPHWVDHPGHPAESWPVAYVRGPGAGHAGPRTLRVRFQCVGHALNGLREVRGVTGGAMVTDVQNVNFANGDGQATFTLQNVPATVDRLSRVQFSWEFRPQHRQHWSPKCQTEHSFFFVDAAPVAAVGDVAPGQPERLYFELFNWSCGWASVRSGAANVLAAIWGQFTPVKAAHATGLIYWRAYQTGIAPAQDVADGIRSQDAAGNQQYAISCIVWDRIFCNALAAHGIRAAEIMLEPHPLLAGAVPPRPYPPADTFVHPNGMAYLKPSGWNIANRAGHGNPMAPPSWGSHWIAAVDPGGGAWTLYDPSYGATHAPWAAPPAVNGTLAVPGPYEVAGGVTFDLLGNTSGAAVTLPTQNPNDPQLEGTVLYTN